MSVEGSYNSNVANQVVTNESELQQDRIQLRREMLEKLKELGHVTTMNGVKYTIVTNKSTVRRYLLTEYPDETQESLKALLHGHLFGY